MIRPIPVVALIAAALAVPPVRATLVRLLARAGRATQVGVVPSPHRS